MGFDVFLQEKAGKKNRGPGAMAGPLRNMELPVDFPPCETETVAGHFCERKLRWFLTLDISFYGGLIGFNRV